MTNDWTRVRPYFERGTVAHIATLMADGAPRAVPFWIAADGDALLFMTMTDSAKDRDLQRDRRLAISITAPADPLDMASVRGRVVERLTGTDALPIVERIAVAYTGEPYGRRKGLTAFRIRPEAFWSNSYAE